MEFLPALIMLLLVFVVSGYCFVAYLIYNEKEAKRIMIIVSFLIYLLLLFFISDEYKFSRDVDEYLNLR